MKSFRDLYDITEKADKFDIGGFWSQDFAAFKSGKTLEVDIWELVDLEGENLVFTSKTSNKKIETVKGDLWKHNLIYLDNKKRKNIIATYENYKVMYEALEHIVSVL